MQRTLNGFVTPVAKSINQPEGATPPPTPTVKDKKRKKSQVQGEAEKLRPQDKAPPTDNPDDSNDMDIEITEIIPPKDASNVCTNNKGLDHFNKVLGIIEDLTPIVENNEPVTKANFRQVLFMVTTLCQFMFD